jgi:unsaturated rhamnogalacturonyl hydrolase
MALWENYGQEGQLGTAVLLSPGHKPAFAQTKSDYLMLLTVQSGKAITYYAGAGWERGGTFATKEDWNAYVATQGERIASPVSVTYPNVPSGTSARDSLSPIGWSERMADSEIARIGDTLCAPPCNGWWDYTTGLYAASLIRLSKASGNPSYLKSAESIMGSFVQSDGTIATYQQKKPKKENSQTAGTNASPSPTPGDIPLPQVKVPYSLDDIESGVPLLSLHDITGEVRYRKAADFIRNQLGKHPRVKEGGFWHKAIYPEQMWLDGLYMGEPFYAGYAARFGDVKDFNDIALQFNVIDKHAYDPETGLLYHGWDASKKQFWADPKTGLSPSFWSRAIGWYVMGLVDVLDSMPPDHPSRPTLIALLKKTAEGIIRWQDPATGVWWQVTDQGNRPNNYLESTSSCMFVYALAKGINKGYLPSTMTDAVRRGYAGIIANFISTDPDGKISLTRCCKVAGLGLTKKRDGTFDYYTLREPIVTNDLKGVGPFINAGIECEKLLQGERFTH